MISREEVLKLAELARLQLHDGEIEGLQKDISSILDYVGQVSQSAAGVEKESPLHRNALRPDTPREVGDVLADKEQVLKAAFPTEEGGFNVVRKIIQKDE